jgi:hypothetical protein
MKNVSAMFCYMEDDFVEGDLTVRALREIY